MACGCGGAKAKLFAAVAAAADDGAGVGAAVESLPPHERPLHAMSTINKITKSATQPMASMSFTFFQNITFFRFRERFWNLTDEPCKFSVLSTNNSIFSF